jgi:hypothetical protein
MRTPAPLRGEALMSSVATCSCSLCRLEDQLLSAFSRDGVDEDLGASRRLPAVTFSEMLKELRSSKADSRNDEWFVALLGLRPRNPQFVDALFVIAFLPLLHSLVRRIAKHQQSLAPDDVAQQAIATLLVVLGSRQVLDRTSHLAFVIARAVKRKMFIWANRESLAAKLREGRNGNSIHDVVFDDAFEPLAMLRHFLDHCTNGGLLTEAEINLLVDFKLDGVNGASNRARKQKSSNAERQRLKRLFAKLRRLAATRTGASHNGSHPGPKAFALPDKSQPNRTEHKVRVDVLN